jgi:hypothetical protein
MAANPASTATQLIELKAALSRAQDLIAQLSEDPLVERMLQAFGRLPMPDREPIVRVLERDATWCRIVEQTADTTGITVRPNPHASLYVQIVEQVPDQPLQRDVDVIRYGIEQFVALLPLLFQEDVHALWTISGRALIRDVDPELREYAARLVREVAVLLMEAEAPAADSTTGTNSTAAGTIVPAREKAE